MKACSSVTVTWATLRGGASVTALPGAGPLATFQERTGMSVDLPTHAMYESAIRFGVRTIFMGGNDNKTNLDYIDGKSYTYNVGKHKPNHHGIFDILGPLRAWYIDAEPQTSYNVDESALANNFMPLTYGTNRSYFDTLGANPYTDNRLKLASTYYLSATRVDATLGFRLAVYPADYYPNGGK